MKWTFTLTIVYGRYADKDEAATAAMALVLSVARYSERCVF
jgi:hypothetical protein